MSVNILSYFLVWFALYAITWLFWIWAQKRGFDYASAPFFATSYFALSALVHFFVFRSIIAAYIPVRFFIFYPVLLVVFVLLHMVLHRLFHIRWSNEKIKHSFRNADVGAWSKHWELLFQQVSFISLWVLVQTGFSGSYIQQSIIVIILFFVLHLPLLFFLRRLFAWYYSLFSIFGSLLFCLLLPMNPYGFMLAYMVHSLFYAATTGFFGA